jgi:6-pyruvoyltetrahydropterin/6-carboxytetrahydropterin synthase
MALPKTMYEITVESSFDAAHRLPDDAGNCRRLHGHTYRVQARFRSSTLRQDGMALDFRRAKDALRAALDHLDHQYINELPEFSAQPPTAENIARIVFERVEAAELPVHSVSVWETPTSCAAYFGQE